LSDKARFLGNGTIRGRLYDLGNYPGVLPSEAGEVHGELYEIEDGSKQLNLLDQIEDFDPNNPESSLFVRALTEVRLSDNISKLVQLNRLDLYFESEPFEALLLNLTIFPITMRIAQTSTKLDFHGDPSDELIAATSIIEGIPLLTRNRSIRRSKRVPLAI
jgi:gamma-glutamylcyclotransferase (GGCT)/AIG2-like uncharacterized protein YtfP